jgi:signal transduction histidine kinase
MIFCAFFCLTTFAVMTFSQPSVHAQIRALDSLKTRWAAVQHHADDTAKVHLLNDLSEKYRLYANDIVMSESTARHALSMATKLHFIRGAGDALHRLSLLYFILSKYDSARAYSLKALSARTQANDYTGMGRSLNALGLTYQYQGNYVQASEFYFRALPLQERVRDSIGLAVSFDNLGTCFRMQGNFERAIEFHTRSLEVNNVIGNKTHSAYAMMGLGAVFEAQGLYEESFQMYTNALHIRRELHHQQGIAISMAALGKLYHKRREPLKALETQERALALQDSIHDRNGMAASMVEIGRLHLEARRLEPAQYYAQQALQLAQEIGSKLLLYEALQLCGEVFRAGQRFEDAVVYLTSAAAVKDSVFSQQNAQHLAELTAQRELDRKEQALQLLAKDKELSAAWRNGLGAGLVLLAALLLVLIVRYRENKRANAEIMRQQHILEEQAREIEVINAELQTANDSLEQKNALLLDLNDEKNEFLGIATHDLKSPLSGIRNLARVLESDHARIEPERIRTFAELICRSADQMFALIKNLLDVNAIEQGINTLYLHTIDAVPIVCGVVENMRHRADEKSITVHCSMPPSLLVCADTLALEQVIENVVSNAIKFSPHRSSVFLDVWQGEYRVDMLNKAVESLANDQPTAYISVRDEGPGITEHDKPRLFGKFARLSAKPTGEEHSTGLGLSIAKKMVEEMHGQIWCESQPEQGIVGAVFVIALPVPHSIEIEKHPSDVHLTHKREQTSSADVLSTL